MSYHSYPFINYDRKEAGMLPTAQPAFPQPQIPLIFKPLEPGDMIQPAAPMTPAMPAAPMAPAMPAAPMAPAMPGMMPGTAMPGMMPGNVMPGMMPGNVMPGMMPGNVMPGMMPVNVMPGMMPGNVMPGMMPGNAMPGIMPVCPYMPSTGYIPDTYDMEDMDVGTDIPDPRQLQPILSNPPATTTITLFKELTGYPNYGNPSGNADILYTGNRGVWTFNIPAFLFVPGNLRAQIAIRAVLDDHTAVPVSSYSARITINGTVVHTGRVPLEHGTPAGGMFNNWRLLTFNIPNFRRTNRVVIENTSSTGPNDWIAFDWMELRLIPR